MPKKTKRLNVDLTNELYQQIKALAEEKGTSESEMVRRLAVIGIELHTAERDPDRAVLIQDDRGKRELVFI